MKDYPSYARNTSKKADNYRHFYVKLLTDKPAFDESFFIIDNFPATTNIKRKFS